MPITGFTYLHVRVHVQIYLYMNLNYIDPLQLDWMRDMNKENMSPNKCSSQKYESIQERSVIGTAMFTNIHLTTGSNPLGESTVKIYEMTYMYKYRHRINWDSKQETKHVLKLNQLGKMDSMIPLDKDTEVTMGLGQAE